jgi:cytochrome c biogenesis protein CcdA
MHGKRKYLLTQISAPIVGLTTSFFVVKILAQLFPQILREQGITQVIIIVVSVFVLLGLSIYLWGRLLILVGILDKEEAKGYPFSKPWEKKEGESRS